MHKHIDPVYDFYVDLDEIDKVELYDKYAKLVEKYRDLQDFANDLFGVIDEQFDLTEQVEILQAYSLWRNDPDNATPVTPALLVVMVDDYGAALRAKETKQ